MGRIFLLAPSFEKSYKRLKKKYSSIETDLESFKKAYVENPDIGEDLGEGFRKVRIAIKSKNRGKRGGARIITYDDYDDIVIKAETGIVVLVEIYDKSEISTLSKNEYEKGLRDFLANQSK